MKTHLAASLLCIPLACFSQPLATESFIIGSSGVGYKEEVNLASSLQNLPPADTGILRWISVNHNVEQAVKAGSLEHALVSRDGGRLYVNTTGVQLRAILDATTTGPFSEYVTAEHTIGESNTTLYMSVLLNITQTPNAPAMQNYMMLETLTVDPFFGTYIPTEKLMIGQALMSSTWTFGSLSNKSFDNTTHLIVAKLEFKPGDDAYTIWFDPDVLLPEAQNTPVTTGNRDLSFHAIEFQSHGGTITVDEIVFGKSFQDVTPIRPLYNFNHLTYSNGTFTRDPISSTYSEGKTVTLQATPDFGYRFTGWSGDVAEQDILSNPLTVVMDSDKTITPVFAPHELYFDSDAVTRGPDAAQYSVGVESTVAWLATLEYVDPPAGNWINLLTTTGSGNGQIVYSLLENTTTEPRTVIMRVTQSDDPSKHDSFQITQEPVVIPPAITAEPESQSAIVGQYVELSVDVSGSDPFTIVWYKGDQALSDNGRIHGSSSKTLTLDNAMASDEGEYHVVIANDAGEVVSAKVTLKVVVAPGLVSSPESIRVYIGQAAYFNANTTGNHLTFQWYRDESPLTDDVRIQGAQTSSLIINPVTASDAGAYSVVISNLAGSLISELASLEILSSIFENSEYTYDLGDGFKWNTLFEFTYDGYYPFVYLFKNTSWIYVFGESEHSGYFFYNFTSENWGWSAGAYYPYYVKYPEGVWQMF